MGEKQSFPIVRSGGMPGRKPPSPRTPDRYAYLHVGDRVFHKKFRAWGRGVVMEAWTSKVPGGLCYVRILFQDGRSRVFDNDFDSACCCYYAGITLLDRVEL